MNDLEQSGVKHSVIVGGGEVMLEEEEEEVWSEFMCRGWRRG